MAKNPTRRWPCESSPADYVRAVVTALAADSAGSRDLTTAGVKASQTPDAPHPDMASPEPGGSYEPYRLDTRGHARQSSGAVNLKIRATVNPSAPAPMVLLTVEASGLQV